MTTAEAVRLACDCIDRRLHKIAFEANLAERCGATYPAARSALRERARLRQARRMLQEMAAPVRLPGLKEEAKEP